MNMNIFLKLSAILFLSMTQSCDSTKASATEKKAETNTTKEMNTLISEGYVAGTIKYQVESKCSYILIDEKTGIKYDPVNIGEEKFMPYKNDANKVYFKYLSLRRMNRCNEASPVQLIDIQLRQE